MITVILSLWAACCSCYAQIATALQSNWSTCPHGVMAVNPSKSACQNAATTQPFWREQSGLICIWANVWPRIQMPWYTLNVAGPSWVQNCNGAQTLHAVGSSWPLLVHNTAAIAVTDHYVPKLNHMWSGFICSEGWSWLYPCSQGWAPLKVAMGRQSREQKVGCRGWLWAAKILRSLQSAVLSGL